MSSHYSRYFIIIQLPKHFHSLQQPAVNSALTRNWIYQMRFISSFKPLLTSKFHQLLATAWKCQILAAWPRGWSQNARMTTSRLRGLVCLKREANKYCYLVIKLSFRHFSLCGSHPAGEISEMDFLGESHVTFNLTLASNTETDQRNQYFNFNYDFYKNSKWSSHIKKKRELCFIPVYAEFACKHSSESVHES